MTLISKFEDFKQSLSAILGVDPKALGKVGVLNVHVCLIMLMLVVFVHADVCNVGERLAVDIVVEVDVDGDVDVDVDVNVDVDVDVDGVKVTVDGVYFEALDRVSRDLISGLIAVRFFCSHKVRSYT